MAHLQMQNVLNVENRMTEQERQQALSSFPNFWNIKKKPEFTELEIAAMEGGHSLEKDRLSFIKYVLGKNTPLGPL